jgi:hypothetical protein
LAEEYLRLLTLIPFSKYVFEFKVIKKISLPIFPGLTLRSSFGFALKNVCCATLLGEWDETKEISCSTCPASEYCPFVKIFESPSGYLSQSTAVPPAFALSAPINLKTVFSEEETLEFGLTLFGNYSEYILLIIESLKTMGRVGFKNGKAILSKVYFENPSSRKRQTYIDGRLGLLYRLNEPKKEDAVVRINEILSRDIVTVNFISPTDTVVDQRAGAYLTFTNLIRLITRRANLLATQYGTVNSKQSKKPLMSIYDTKKLIEDSKTVGTVKYELYDFQSEYEHISKSTGDRVKLNGITGAVTYKGNFSEFIPLLLLGEQIHIGKHPSFGLGEYEINFKGGFK